jgi:hypothetical protein
MRGLNKQSLSTSRQLVYGCTEAYPTFTVITVIIKQHFKPVTPHPEPPHNHIFLD